MHRGQSDGGDRQQDRLETLVPRPEQPGERPEDDGGHGGVDHVAGHHEDEQRDREGHVGAGPLLPERQQPVEAEPLQDHREELHGEDRDVEADAPRDLEHGRVVRGLQAELVEVPRQTEVGDERDRDERIAQEAHQDGLSSQPVQVFSLEDIDGPGHRERARRDGDPDEVEEDPEAPGVRVGEVGAAAEAAREPQDHREAAERDEDQQDPVERGHQPLIQPLERDVMAVVRMGVGRVHAARSVRHRLHPLAEVRVGAPEQGPESHHGRRHRPERRRGQPRKRLLPVGREPELLERHRREVQHARSAQLLLSVDVVDVLFRAIVHALAGEREHVVAASVAQGVRRARLDARRRRDALDEALALGGGQRLSVECDRGRLVRCDRRSACTCRSSAPACPTPPSARPRGRRACSTGSRCTWRRRRTPAHRAAGTAPSSDRPRRSRAPGSGNTAASRTRCPGRPGSSGSPSRGKR